MTRDLDALAREKDALVESDGSGFRRAARVLQSIWRDKRKLPIGEHNGVPLGSRLAEAHAETELTNYLTPGVREVVRSKLATATDSQLFAKPRIFNDLLSSQPLCFNLFGELKLDPGLAKAALNGLHPGLARGVTNVDFEYSPGRSDDRFTGDRSAFDVFIEYEPRDGGRGFLGIEVKYHESLQESAARHRERYDEVAAQMACFRPTCMMKLRQAPLQQLWRDHLLVGSMLNDQALGYTHGSFVFVYPAANAHCRAAVLEYKQCLSDPSTFDAWTIEEMVSILALATPAPWVEELRERYLGFGSLASR